MYISVIIPVYNRENYLPTLFDSINNIKGIELEFVFVDNGSTDRSLMLCEAFASNHANDALNILVITEEKKGAPAARNAGLRHCRGDYVYFFDSDDELSPNFFADCLKHDGKDVIVCKTKILVNGKERERKTIFPLTLHGHILSATLSTQSFVIRRSYLQDIGDWDEKLLRWNDWELGVRIMIGQPNITQLKGTYHRILQHSDSITGNNFAHSCEDLIKALNKAQQDIATAHIEEEKKRKAYNALNAKAKMLSAWLYQENQKELSDKIEQLATQIKTSPKYRVLSPPLHFFSKKGLKGVWMLYNLII